MNRAIIATLAASLLVPGMAIARGGGHSSGHSYSGHPSTYCTTCARDSNGHIARSESAKEQFMRETGYPHGRPGYVVDHIQALKHGGADDPSNMQWQTKADAKAKDKWE